MTYLFYMKGLGSRVKSNYAVTNHSTSTHYIARLPCALCSDCVGYCYRLPKSDSGSVSNGHPPIEGHQWINCPNSGGRFHNDTRTRKQAII